MFRVEAATAPVLKIASAMGTAGTTTFANAGITPGVAFTVGGAAQTLTLSSSAASGTALIINASDNAGGIAYNSGLTWTTTAGTKYANRHLGSFSPTSGSADYADTTYEYTVNQTGGASGVTRGLYFVPTITAAADHRIIAIETSASVKAIYQSSANPTNYFVGKTAFGSTTTPTEKVNITGNLLVAGQYASTRFGLTDGGTIALDWNNSNVQSVTIAGNRTFTFANPKEGGRYLILLKQDATGSRTVTWPTITWAGGTAPTLTTTGNKTDIITLIYANSTYYGEISKNY